MYAVRQIQLRYRQSALGLSWTLVQPIAIMAIYGFIFTQFFELAEEGALTGQELSQGELEPVDVGLQSYTITGQYVNDDGVATLEYRDDGVGGPEVDSDRTSHSFAS